MHTPLVRNLTLLLLIAVLLTACKKNKEEDVFTYTLQKEKITEIRNQFPFWQDADSFIIKDI